MRPLSFFRQPTAHRTPCELAGRLIDGLPGVLAETGANLGVWARDYAYALRWQGSGVLRRHDPHAYRRPDPDKPAVVLLPGIYERWTFLLPVADALRTHGYDVHAVVDLGYNGGTIEEMAHRVDRHIRREGVERCVLVAHSKGGLIGKRLLAHHNQATVIQGVVAVNTPFTGSTLARLLPLPALRVFLPHSPELAALSSSRHVNRDIVSIYGRFDPHIPGGSSLEGAHNVQLDTRGHFLPLSDPRVHEAILDGIRTLAR
jgi:triacylglycerol lipase